MSREEVPSAGVVRAYSPGRVNLIGDHTDYNEGLALPMAVGLGTTVTFTPDASSRIVLVSGDEADPADVDLAVTLEPEGLRAIEPPWARLVAATVAVVRPATGGRGRVETTLPIGAGLSSSAALEVALALALGLRADPLGMAKACQRAEQAATGIATGVMDQLTVSAATEGCALLTDFADLTVRPVPLAEGAQVLVVHSGQRRTLDRTGYAARRAECEAAAARLKPLGRLLPEDLTSLNDPVLRRRARHVVTECARVRQCAAALERGDLTEAGALMTASHRSLAQDFEASTPELDELVERLLGFPGVFGARMTGAGFGGCVVALTRPGAVDPDSFAAPAWHLRPSGGAHLLFPR